MAFFKKMKINDGGPNVKTAQELLKKAGSSIEVNGIYSIGMVSAVRSFQRKNGLKVTGIIDAETWKKLVAVKAKKSVKMAAKK